MIGQKQRAAIARTPPVRTSADLEGNVEESELSVEFLEVDVPVVLDRPNAQGVSVADEFGVNRQGQNVTQLEPASQVGLNLLAVGVELAHPVFPEPDAPMPDRKSVALNLETRANAYGVDSVPRQGSGW